MKLRFLCIFISVLSLNSFAGEFQPLREKKVRDFNQLKLDVLKSIDERNIILQNEKKCVEGAINEKDLRLCFKGAKEERKKISEEIKSGKK